MFVLLISLQNSVSKFKLETEKKLNTRVLNSIDKTLSIISILFILTAHCGFQYKTTFNRLKEKRNGFAKKKVKTS